ncbi:hypothetical protein ACHAPU_006264 [Fusarium lateritium]
MCCIGLGYCRSATTWVVSLVICKAWDWRDNIRERNLTRTLNKLDRKDKKKKRKEKKKKRKEKKKTA